jgi:DNA repair protein RecO (recombination protein O)
MDWRDEGILLSSRKHGETSVIIEVFTAEHGRHAGIVRGGVSRKLKPVLQPGSQVAVEWSARLEEHLGTYRVEPVQSRAASVMGDRLALEGMNALLAMVRFALPEREVIAGQYEAVVALADDLGTADWPARYVLWERELLGELGFGLDLTACAATGVQDGLAFVSPKTGRAVSSQGAGEWADRLLALPAFMIGGEAAQAGDVAQGLALTGYFLTHHFAVSLGKDSLPDARERFVRLIEKLSR